jgi:hypothetical protein
VDRLQADAADDGGDEHGGSGATTFWGAMKTIVIADALMGVDNVLGVAGAAHGAFDLVVIGLLISIPIVVFGSTLVLKLVERFPSIIQHRRCRAGLHRRQDDREREGARPVLQGPGNIASVAYWAVCVLAIVGVLAAGWLRNRRTAANQGRPGGLSRLYLSTSHGTTHLRRTHHGKDHCVCGRRRPRTPAARPHEEHGQGSAHRTHWVLVACAPRMTHRISKWVSHSARENWRAKWADKLFAQIVPGLQASGDSVTVVLAKGPLPELTEQLKAEHGTSRVLDARRPKFGPEPSPHGAGDPASGRQALGHAPALCWAWARCSCWG